MTSWVLAPRGEERPPNAGATGQALFPVLARGASSSPTLGLPHASSPTNPRPWSVPSPNPRPDISAPTSPPTLFGRISLVCLAPMPSLQDCIALLATFISTDIALQVLWADLREAWEEENKHLDPTESRFSLFVWRTIPTHVVEKYCDCVAKPRRAAQKSDKQDLAYRLNSVARSLGTTAAVLSTLLGPEIANKRRSIDHLVALTKSRPETTVDAVLAAIVDAEQTKPKAVRSTILRLAVGSRTFAPSPGCQSRTHYSNSFLPSTDPPLHLPLCRCTALLAPLTSFLSQLTAKPSFPRKTA